MEIGEPSWWQDALVQLNQDELLGPIVKRYPEGGLSGKGNVFSTIIRAIVGQQISVKAAQTVWDRFALLPTRMTPANILKLKVDDMRAAGLSARKVEYLVDLSLNFDSGNLQIKKWSEMDDEDIIAELVAIRGIGRWTAEMFLMFTMGRLDVWPVGDLAVRRGWQIVHGLKEMPNEKQMEPLGDPFSPYRSIAAWYCWRVLEPQEPW